MKKTSWPLWIGSSLASILGPLTSSAIFANENPFQLQPLSSGYQVTQAESTTSTTNTKLAEPSEEKQEKASEGKCGSGKCGMAAKKSTKLKKRHTTKNADAKCGGKSMEGKCGNH